MAFWSARWRCSPEFFGNPWSKESDANVEGSECRVQMLLFFSITDLKSLFFSKSNIKLVKIGFSEKATKIWGQILFSQMWTIFLLIFILFFF